MLPPWLILAAVAPKPKRLICKSAGECKDKNCDHIVEHERDYVCSHWCNVRRAIVTCRVVG